VLRFAVVRNFDDMLLSIFWGDITADEQPSDSVWYLSKDLIVTALGRHVHQYSALNGESGFKWPVVTPFRLTFTLTVLIIGGAKAGIAAAGYSTASNILDWFLAVYYAIL
jgi:hypothetical protein